MKITIDKILDFVFIDSKYLTITMVDVLEVLFIIVLVRTVIFLSQRIINRRIKHHRLDAGKGQAFAQIAKYFIYAIAFILVLDSVGIKITVLLAGSTALFVGLGLGLQDAFKDFAAGFILLSERSISVSDIIEVEGTVGQVTEIGLRTTKIRSRNEIEMIIPNQKLTSNHIINWSHNNKNARFDISIGVAYGSDTQLVRKILVDIANEHPSILKEPKPYIFFGDFGSNSLEFKLLFFSNNLFRIERVKSEIRFEIDKKFRENKINIAFPQLDIWFKNNLHIENPNK